MSDKYADKLKIPSDIKVFIPSDTSLSEKNFDTFPNFQLYNSFQPGLYSYSIWVKKSDSGYCYLKAYEVTKNDPLSVERLKEASKIKLFNPTDNVAIFSLNIKDNNNERYFTIYEGDWGKPYAARFEVWFVPANGGQERKLVDKNFKIEGWMR